MLLVNYSFSQLVSQLVCQSVGQSDSVSSQLAVSQQSVSSQLSVSQSAIQYYYFLQNILRTSAETRSDFDGVHFQLFYCLVTVFHDLSEH